MPSIGYVLPRATMPPVLYANASAIDSNTLLFTTLGLILFACFASAYTGLRTLLPLVPPHPLTRRTTGSAQGPYPAAPAPPPKPLRLKSAQRFTVWLAAIDIVASVVLVWEASVAASSGRGLGGGQGGASRLYISCTARSTLLMVTAILSYVNVVQGRSIALGWMDWIVWAPAIAILGLGAGLASIPQAGSTSVWLGLIAWEAFVTAIVTLCFGRLLVAILRVRRWTQAASPAAWAAQSRAASSRNGSKTFLPSFLPPMHSNFSGLSTSFISTIGTATHHNTTYASSQLSDSSPDLPSLAPSFIEHGGPRPSGDSDGRDFRSPTPGSTRRLLASPDPYSDSQYAVQPDTPRARQHPSAYAVADQSTPDHQAINFEDMPRPSIGSFASASSYAHVGGLIGGSATRQAIASEVWGHSLPPHVPTAPTVELSRHEARGALVRIGGHLASCLLHFALVCPFLFKRRMDSTAVPPLHASVLLVVAIIQPSICLAIQTWTSEGFWFRHEKPPVLTSSSAAALEQHDNEKEPATPSSFGQYHRRYDSAPGIPTGSIDCEDVPKGRIGRAMSMIYPHPKLLILPNDSSSSVNIVSGTSSYSRNKSCSGHVRLRSLTLAKTASSLRGAGHKRSSSNASRATVAGFEYTSPPKAPSDRTAHRSSLQIRNVAVSPDLDATRSVALPKDYSIDFLSSQVLPRLVPSVRLGKNTPVQPESGPLNPRKSIGGERADSTPRSSFANGTTSTRGTRNTRNLSLAGLGQNTLSKLTKSRSPALNEQWIELKVEQYVASSPRSPFIEIADQLREGSGGQKQHQSRGRSDQAWEAIEAAEEVDEVEASPTRRLSADRSRRSNEVQDLEVEEDPRPPAPRFARRTRTAGEEETETLDEMRFADESSETEDDAHARFDAHVRARRSPSPLFDLPSPKSPFWDPQVPDANETQPLKVPSSTLKPPSALPTSPTNEESEVFRGSHASSEDEEMGVIKCATIRPVSRTSSFDALSPRSTEFSPQQVLRHVPVENGSVSSSKSIDEAPNSITSQGFRNMLQSNTWHSDTGTNTTDAESSGTDSDATSYRRHSGGLRPLSLLGQRDPNTSQRDSFSSSADDEALPPSKLESKARPARSREAIMAERQRQRQRQDHLTQRHRSSAAASFTSAALPIPPIPPTIEEMDEDRKSGTPTPRARRRKMMEEDMKRKVTPLTSTPPRPASTSISQLVLEPNEAAGTSIPTSYVNSKRGRHSRAVQKVVVVADENVAPQTEVSKRTSAVGGGAGGGVQSRSSSTAMRTFR